jgi:membrane associated rhomboid family serine protease
VTVSLITLCVLIFLWQLTVGREAWVHWACRPTDIAAGVALYTLVTSQFLHAHWLHLLGNMYFLYILGDNVEDVLGRWRYLLFYLSCGVVAGGTHVLLNFDSTLPLVGASGAIAGLMAAYLVLFRQARLTFMFLVFQFKVAAWAWIGLWFAIQVLGAVADFGGGRTHIGWLAHIGGFLAGLVFIWPFQGSLLKRQPLLRLLRTCRRGAAQVPA